MRWRHAPLHQGGRKCPASSVFTSRKSPSKTHLHCSSKPSSSAELLEGCATLCRSGRSERAWWVAEHLQICNSDALISQHHAGHSGAVERAAATGGSARQQGDVLRPQLRRAARPRQVRWPAWRCPRGRSGAAKGMQRLKGLPRGREAQAARDAHAGGEPALGGQRRRRRQGAVLAHDDLLSFWQQTPAPAMPA